MALPPDAIQVTATSWVSPSFPGVMMDANGVARGFGTGAAMSQGSLFAGAGGPSIQRDTAFGGALSQPFLPGLPFPGGLGRTAAESGFVNFQQDLGDNDLLADFFDILAAFPPLVLGSGSAGSSLPTIPTTSTNPPPQTTGELPGGGGGVPPDLPPSDGGGGGPDILKGLGNILKDVNDKLFGLPGAVLSGALEALPAFIAGFGESEVRFEGASPEEIAILQELLRASQIQAGLAGQQQEFTELLAAAGFNELELQRQNQEIEAQLRDPQLLAQEELRRRDQLSALQEEFQAASLRGVDQGLAATPEQLELIGQAAQAEFDIGSSDILTRLEDELHDIAQRQAQARGLRSTDTPIQTLAARSARGAEAELGELSRRVRDTQATANLEFPMFAAQSVAQQPILGQQLAQSGEATLQQLQQDEFNNQLARLGAGGTSLLGLQGAASNALGSQASGLASLQAGRGELERTDTIPGGAFAAAGAGGLLDIFRRTA